MDNRATYHKKYYRVKTLQKLRNKIKSLEETCSNRAQLLSSDTATCEDMGLWSEEL